MKWPSRAAPRDSMRKACGITTSSATAAAMLRTWSGTTCPGLPRAPSASGFFANANSFSGGSARSALRGALPVKCHRSLLTNSKEDGTHGERTHTQPGRLSPNNQEQNLLTEAKCPVARGPRRHTVAGAPTNAGWWPNQLNLKILHQHSPLSDPMDKEFNYAEGIQEPRPGCRDQGPACLDDGRRRTGGRPTMATMGRFSFAWRGTAPVRTASATAAAGQAPAHNVLRPSIAGRTMRASIRRAGCSGRSSRSMAGKSPGPTS